MISSVMVVIPARNEVDRIEACLESALVALEAAPAGVETGVWVVADRCRDGSEKVVERVIGGRPGCGWQVSTRPFTIGQVRRLGFQSALAHVRSRPLDCIWMISTDADSTVPPNWIVDHLKKAATGATAVAGAAALDSLAHLHPLAAERYRRLLSQQRSGGQHHGAYAANLGVRADAYLAVGGFRDMATGEDADLLSRLEAHGYSVMRPVGIEVRTSARFHGRAQGGLSVLLRSLHDEAHGERDVSPSTG